MFTISRISFVIVSPLIPSRISLFFFEYIVIISAKWRCMWVTWYCGVSLVGHSEVFQTVEGSELDVVEILLVGLFHRNELGGNVGPFYEERGMPRISLFSSRNSCRLSPFG